MSSIKHGGTKCRKNKKGSNRNPARPVSDLGNLGERVAFETSTLSSLPSTSAMALPLQAATASSCPNSDHSLLEAADPLGDNERKEQEEIQREPCEEAVHTVDAPNQISTAAAEVEPIELDESAVEVVDLTCESSEYVVVDLTHNDSDVFVEECSQRQNQELRNQLLPKSCILNRRNDSKAKGSNVCVTNKLPKGDVADSGNSGTVSCPICMEGYLEIMQSGRLIMSTKCGHIFCNQCLRDSLKNSSFCPTCRKKLNNKQCHPIYI